MQILIFYDKFTHTHTHILNKYMDFAVSLDSVKKILMCQVFH
jgi:phage anti-repressor protein